MKNKLPEMIKEELVMYTTDSKLNEIIAYLKEKEDISKSLEEELKNLEKRGGIKNINTIIKVTPMQ